MDRFIKAVKRNLERRGFRVTESDNYAFDFISTTPKGEKVAVKCKPHGHVYAPQKRELLNIGIGLGLHSIYIASEAYSDSSMHVVKLTKLV